MTTSRTVVHQYRDTTLAGLVDAIGGIISDDLSLATDRIDGSTSIAAAGVWLDCIGERLGLARPQTHTPVRTGVADDIYRLLLRARAVAITSGCDALAVGAALDILYGGGWVEDRQDLTAVIHIPIDHDPALHQAVLDVRDSVIPRPAGVAYSIVVDIPTHDVAIADTLLAADDAIRAALWQPLAMADDAAPADAMQTAMTYRVGLRDDYVYSEFGFDRAGVGFGLGPFGRRRDWAQAG